LTRLRLCVTNNPFRHQGPAGVSDTGANPQRTGIPFVFIFVNSIWQDLRYGLRGLRKQPSFTVLAMLALALGIGSATTIVSVIDNVLLDPFPYTDAQRIVMVAHRYE
jgi:hypothetical protein